MGVKIINQYALLGAYDFVNISMRLIIRLWLKWQWNWVPRGTLQTTTLAAFSVNEFISMLKK